MSSGDRAVKAAFQAAVDRALCRVSRKPFDRIRAEGGVEAVERINGALAQLEGLRGRSQPKYRDCDVALFYSQWYLPQQINVTYSESTRILRECAIPSADELQIVDFGAGTGAMSIGVSLAITTQVKRKDWPELISVYQIDHPAMLDLGRAIWCRIRDEAGSQPILGGLVEVMDRTLFESAPLDQDLNYEKPPQWKDAARWLTAIHVAYDGHMDRINAEMQALCVRLDPLVRIRTVPSFKMPLLESHLAVEEGPQPVELCMVGSARCTTSTRERLRDHFGDRLSPLSAEYLAGSVPWTPIGKNNAPLAETICWPGAK